MLRFNAASDTHRRPREGVRGRLSARPPADSIPDITGNGIERASVYDDTVEPRAVAFLGVITTLFASFGVVVGLVVEDFDHLTVLNQFILRPLVFFGGVFYSLEALGAPYRTLSLLNPMVYVVNGVRYGVIGVSDIDPTAALAVLSGLTVVVLAVDVWLFQRGYGLTD